MSFYETSTRRHKNVLRLANSTDSEENMKKTGDEINKIAQKSNKKELDDIHKLKPLSGDDLKAIFQKYKADIEPMSEKTQETYDLLVKNSCERLPTSSNINYINHLFKLKSGRNSL